MSEEFDAPSNNRGRATALVTVVAAMAGAGAIYFLTTDRGRRWMRELPEMCRVCAATTRDAMALLRDITEQVERAVGTFEQALGHVGETLAARETSRAGSGRNGGEHALTG